MRRFSLLVASLAVPVALYACADDNDSVPGPKPLTAVDATTPTADAGAEGAVDAAIDQAAPAAPCSQAELDAVASAAGGDYTAVTTPIAVTFGGAPAQYTNHCIKVKVGATVTFTGSFASHPLERNGGDSPSPIPALTNADPDGGSLSLTMSAAGKFGYRCQIHTGIMFGAIQVVP